MISGSLVALVTPMHADGSVDWKSLDGLLDWHVSAGTNGIVAVGTTGESATLGVAEHCQVISHTVARINGAIPVIAGTGANSTQEAIELTEAARGAGANACLLVTPYYNKPTQEGLYQHHRAVSEAVDIAQILYNVPGRTGVDMLPDTVDRLADIDNIVGIKEATGDLQRGREVIDRCADRLTVLSGDDPTAAELILMGAKGNISVTANVVPERVAVLCQHALQGDRDAALALDRQLSDLNSALFVQSNPIPVKWALQRMGRIQAGLRLPMTELDESCHSIVEAALRGLELI